MPACRSRFCCLPILIAAAAVWLTPAGVPAKTKPRPADARPSQTAAKKTEQKYKGIFEPVSFPEDINLKDVFFISDDEGWVVGDKSTILHTSDGGAKWTPLMGGDPQATATSHDTIANLHFVDRTHGWAVQGHSKLLGTTDGQSWNEINSKFSSHCSDSTYTFTSPSAGVCARSDKISRTQDGGKTWQEVFSCGLKVQAKGMTQNVKCQVEAVHFPTAQTGYMLTREVGPGLFAVLKTTDAGANWESWTVENELDAKDGYLVFLDENRGYAVLRGGRLHSTADGGRTWVGVTANVNGVVQKKIDFADPQVAWSLHYSNGHHLSWTTDGGKRWLSRPVALPFSGYVYGFSLPSRQRGYVVSDHGAIFRYRVVPVEYKAPGIVDAPAMPGGSESSQ